MAAAAAASLGIGCSVPRFHWRYAIQPSRKGNPASSVALVISATPHRIPYANQSRARFESATASVAHKIVAASNPEREVSQTHWNGMMAAFGKMAHIQAAPAPTAMPAIAFAGVKNWHARER